MWSCLSTQLGRPKHFWMTQILKRKGGEGEERGGRNLNRPKHFWMAEMGARPRPRGACRAPKVFFCRREIEDRKEDRFILHSSEKIENACNATPLQKLPIEEKLWTKFTNF